MTDEALLELMSNRREIYAFLSRLFREEISREFLEATTESDFLVQLTALEKKLDSSSPDEMPCNFVEYLRLIKVENVEEILKELSVDYASIFLGLAKPPAHPYESLYVDSTGLVMGKAFDEVRSAFAEAGLSKWSGFVEPEDHIAPELEFMSHLCEKMARTLKHDKEYATYLLLPQINFLKEHAIKWIPEFCDRVANTAQTDFYKAVAILTKKFILLDVKNLDKIARGEKGAASVSMPNLDIDSGKGVLVEKEEIEKEMRTVKSSCCMCHGGCGVLVTTKNDKVVRVEGDINSPLSKGTMCAKGLASKQLLYNPERIKYPMKRMGERGESRWVRISWDEAVHAIADKLDETREKFGVEAVGLACGTARSIVFKYVFLAGYSFGTPNTRIGTPHVCFSPRLTCGTLTFGRPIQYHAEENSRCLLVVGGNFFHSNADQNLAKRLLDGLRKGAKLIVVDPALSSTASKACLWLQIRPGTDCALFLSMLNVIISEGIYDKNFVEKWTVGFDKLAKHVEAYTPERVEKITWVSAEKIREAARTYAASKPACLVLGVKLEQNINTMNTIRAAWLLPAVTGNVDVEGGNLFWESPLPEDLFRIFTQIDLVEEEKRRKALGWFPLLYYPTADPQVWRATATGNPYPIRVLLVNGCNPLVGHENTKVVYEALRSLDFLAVMDHFMTPTAELADIVLPATTYLETDDIDWTFSGLTTGTIFPIRKAVEPLWESKDDKWFFIELSKAAGFDLGFKTVKEMLDWVLSPVRMTFEEFKELGPVTKPQRFRKYESGALRKDGKQGFDTPSGKVEIYSTQLEEMGLDPLPVYKEPKESPERTPEIMKEYPLILITGSRIPVFFHSQYRQLPWLREICPEPLIEVSPRTAETLGINNGDWVIMESLRGSCKMKIHITEGIHPKVVHAPHSWWFPEKMGQEPSLHGSFESNVNVLTDNEPPYDLGFGSTPINALLCRISRLNEVNSNKKSD